MSIEYIIGARVDSTDKAKEIIKNHYCNYCIITGLHKRDIVELGQELHGAHIFPAGKARYIEYKNLPCNIVPIISNRHTGGTGTFDIDETGEERSPYSRIKILEDHVRPEFIEQLKLQLEILKNIMGEEYEP